MSFEIKKASRTAVKPLIGLYSESGCGKTYSALLMARGFVGDNGRVVLVDSESGRGSLYADILPGGYEVMEIGPPFSPARAIEAIEAVEKSGAQIGIMDSASHFWEGIGGVLDMAGTNEENSGKAGLHNWKTPKMEHAKFMLRLLQSSIPWIICLRAKYKSRQLKENGKTVIVKDDTTSPIQAEDFIFELTCHAEILQNHTIILTKASHPALRACFPEDKQTPITMEHGKKLAQWCNNPGTKASPEVDKLKQKLWKLTKPIHGNNMQKLVDWLVEQKLIDTGVVLTDLQANNLETIIKLTEKKMAEKK